VTGTITNKFGTGMLSLDFENRWSLLCTNTSGYASKVSRSITKKSNFSFNVFSPQCYLNTINTLESSVHLLSFSVLFVGAIGRIDTPSVKRGFFGIHE
jgi:hypothetical protein